MSKSLSMEKLTELKARAYDLIAGMERAKFMLDQINKEIAEIVSRETVQNKEPLKPDEE